MPQAKKRYYWEADVQLELRNIALAVKSEKKSKGNREIYLLGAQDWYKDGSVLFDVGKRLRGWFIQQATTAKKSLGESLRYGLKCDSLPEPGPIIIAKIKDITTAPSDEIDQDKYVLDDNLKGIGVPFKEAFSIKEGGKIRPVFSFHYTMNKPMKVSVKIYSFASNFLPENAEEMLNKLGRVVGLGDRHSQGYGCFKLIEFKTIKREELNI